MPTAKPASLRVLAALALPALLTGACSSSPGVSGPPDGQPSSRRVLATVDDRPLPAVITCEPIEGDRFETVAESGYLDLAADGSYDQRVWLRTTRVSDAALIERPNLVDHGRWAHAATGAFTLATTYNAWRADRMAQPLAAERGVQVREQLVHGLGGPVTAVYRSR